MADDKYATALASNKTAQKITSEKRAFKLQYRFKNRLGISQGIVREKVFWWQGSLKEAKNRAMVHCERMGFQFIYCTPHIVDLEAQEELKASDTDADFEDEY